MSKRESSPPLQANDLHAPPPFGVAETTGEHFLPTPMSMEELLDAPEPEATEQPSEEPLPPLAPPPVPAPAPARPAIATEPPPARAVWPIALIVLLVLVVLGGLAGWQLNSNAVARDEGALSGASLDPSPAPAPVDPKPPSTPPPVEAQLPASRDELREMSFEDRHTLLANTRGDVEVETHVALDLLQAEQSKDPCQTFADALNTIEEAKDSQTYRWALDDAKAPQGSAASCDGLSARLDALRQPEAQAQAQAPAPAKKKRKRSTRSRSRASSPSRSEQPAKPTPPVKPPSSSVATKLDDDLRGLGD